MSEIASTHNRRLAAVLSHCRVEPQARYSTVSNERQSTQNTRWRLDECDTSRRSLSSSVVHGHVCCSKLPSRIVAMKALPECRRDGHHRAEVVKQIVNRLR